MKYPWIEEYILKKSSVERDEKDEWEATRYMIRNKMFAMLGGDKEGAPILTLKLEPDFGDFLRRQYKDIVPGYYMNKVHWNSFYLTGDVPDDVVRDMIDRSYETQLMSLPKKAQREIAGQPTRCGGAMADPPA